MFNEPEERQNQLFCCSDKLKVVTKPMNNSFRLKTIVMGNLLLYSGKKERVNKWRTSGLALFDPIEKTSGTKPNTSKSP